MRCPGFRPAKAMVSAGLRSASRSRSACGRAGSATAAAMALGTATGLADAVDASVAKQMAAASVAVDRIPKPVDMMGLSLLWVSESTALRRLKPSRVQARRRSEDFVRRADNSHVTFIESGQRAV